MGKNKMPNHEQWLEWLEENHYDYYVDQDCHWVCKDIVVRYDYGNHIVLEFADNGEFYGMYIDED